MTEKAEKEAEFVGIMLGDGSIGIYNYKSENRLRIQHQLKVTLDSRNKDYICYVSNLMEEVLGIAPKIFFKAHENAADIRIFNKEKVLYALNCLGLKISPKLNNMKIPKNCLKKKLDLFVLKGLFDTDGSITIFRNNGIIYPRIEIRVCPSPAQEQVLNILKKHKFNYRIQRLDKGHIKIRLSGKKELKNWFDKVGSSNNRHIRRANKFL